MWYRKRDRVWIQYLKNIMATDSDSAKFLERYSRRMGITKEYAGSLEVFDLQQYKVVRAAAKVRNALREKGRKPFIFVACKN
ncbi:hypothetical protein GCM10023093_14230 [Nemorincola caseinilytica]|uniref:Uncharacterized protein n=1 Tax=Nemorincola caseinilytica TaxID=2054315 RepID=A0ABP8NDZ4_9BACT